MHCYNVYTVKCVYVDTVYIVECVFIYIHSHFAQERSLGVHSVLETHAEEHGCATHVYIYIYHLHIYVYMPFSTNAICL